jgi:hypothetical protein
MIDVLGLVTESTGMDYQLLFNLAVGALGFLVGIVLTNVWKEIKQLQLNEKETTKRIGEIEVLVAGEYTTKTEFVRVMDKVFEKLDDINNKLTHKADR